MVPDGAYQYKVMPFGMRNLQATFTRMVSKCLEGLTGVNMYVDIVVYNEIWKEHMNTLGKVFEVR